MYITHHLEMSCSGVMFKVPHIVLNKEIRDFIEDRALIQQEYECCNNGYYFIICLANGDRIDCSLK
jgi:hypothetical protein